METRFFAWMDKPFYLTRKNSGISNRKFWLNGKRPAGFSQSKNKLVKCCMCTSYAPRNHKCVSLLMDGSKPRLNDQTFSSNIMFVTQNVRWLNGQTMFDQTSFAAGFVFAKHVDVTQISFLIGCFFPLAQALLAKRSNKMLGQNV